MKITINSMELRNAWFRFSKIRKGIIFSILILLGVHSSLNAQDIYTRPSLWIGVAGGGNLNFYRGTTQNLNSDLITPTAFRHGKGLGLYLAPLIEFHKPDTRFGFMIQAGYDSRKGKFEQVITPCNCPADLSTNLNYLTIEPSLRIAPFKSDFYLYAGPRIALNMSGSFIYQQGINPAFPDQIAEPETKGEFSDIQKAIVSLQIGAGYDISLTDENKQYQAVLSPFISFQPYVGQYPRSVETWNVTTFRVGAALKFGKGRKISNPVASEIVPAVIMADPEVEFSINSPQNIPVERRVRETFPIRNYIFFDLGSSEIPDRYVLLSKGEVKEFREDQIEVFKPKRLTGRSDRQMIAYYNVLNILGDRMVKNPSSKIVLHGSSMQGNEEGKAMAESVRQYLVNIFGINTSRITTKGRIKPVIASEQKGGTLELDLLRQGDRRVSIETSDPELIMEFQSGNDSPLMPVEIKDIQVAPVDSYVTFTVKGSKEAFSSWSLEIRDEKGVLQTFGPYKQEKVAIPGKAILGTRARGDFNVEMVGNSKSGKTVKKESSMHMELWTPSANEEGMRFSVIFEFNQSNAIAMYDKYLSEVVVPAIPDGSIVVIHGHTDIIGDETNNVSLSLDRALEVKGILEKAIAKKGIRDIKYDVYGYGEDVTLSPFDNALPEGRFYNRTVIIDVIPKGIKK